MWGTSHSPKYTLSSDLAGRQWGATVTHGPVKEALAWTCPAPKPVPVCPPRDGQPKDGRWAQPTWGRGDKSRTCCFSTPRKRTWPQHVFPAHLPEALWLLFYSASRNAKTFAKDAADTPLVQLNILIPGSLQEKSRSRIQINPSLSSPCTARAPLSAPSPPPAQEGCRSLRRDGSLFIGRD